MTGRYDFPHGHTKHKWPSHTKIRKRKTARLGKLLQTSFKTQGLSHKDERFSFDDLYKGRQYLLIPYLGIVDCRTGKYLKEFKGVIFR